MKPTLTPIALAVLLSLCGCINLSYSGKRPPASPQVIVQTPPATSADAATIAEIDAAARLNFDNARQECLGQVAQRSGLSPIVQVHLVNVTYRCLTFDNGKVVLLRQLIANPSFSDAARQAIVSQLDHLSFDNHKQEILREVNQRVISAKS